MLMLCCLTTLHFLILVGLLNENRTELARTDWYVSGDKRGPRLAVYDICHPSEAQDARQYVPQDSNNRPRKSYEIEYMHDKGVFETLPNDVGDEIIRCYFEHVHFFIPVVDAATFLNDYTSNRTKLSPLLLWSMVLAAANVSLSLWFSARLTCLEFVNPDLLRRAGYSSRRAMKTVMYERAKVSQSDAICMDTHL